MMNNLLAIILFILSVIFYIVTIYKINKHNNEIKLKNSIDRYQKKYKIITLCGSTRFKNEFMEVQKELTLRGHIVISVGCFGHSGDDEVWNVHTKDMLDDMHKRKIDLADAIMIINKDNYIGESTKSEIEYAKATGKNVYYWYK